MLSRRMVGPDSTTQFPLADRSQLSREEENEIGEEKEVRKVDQERINRFSRIHTKHKALEEELKTKQVCRVFAVFNPIGN